MQQRINTWVESLEESRYKTIQVALGLLLGALAGAAILGLGRLEGYESWGMALGVILCGGTLNILQRVVKRPIRLLTVVNFLTVLAIFLVAALLRFLL